MNCKFNSTCKCASCKNFVNTINVSVFGDTLLLTIPERSLCNCATLCVHVAQEIPATITSNTRVVIQTGNGGTQYIVATPYCANFLYADQIECNKTYCFKFGTDTRAFVYKGTWRLCPTKHVFDCIPIATASSDIPEANAKVAPKVMISKNV